MIGVSGSGITEARRDEEGDIWGASGARKEVPVLSAGCGYCDLAVMGGRVSVCDER